LRHEIGHDGKGDKRDGWMEIKRLENMPLTQCKEGTSPTAARAINVKVAIKPTGA